MLNGGPRTGGGRKVDPVRYVPFRDTCWCRSSEAASFTERSRHIVLLVQPRRVYCPWYLIGLSDAQYDRLRQALVARATTA